MIEYLNAVYTALLLLITVVCLLRAERLDLKKISDGIGSFKDALDFIGSLPWWIHFYNNLNANVQTLHERRDSLHVRLDDMIKQVEDKEFQTGRRRKREVDNWISSAGTKCNDVQTLLLQDMLRETNYFWKFLYRAWLGNLVERLIREVDDIYSLGVFEEVLSPVRERVEFVETLLVGKAANENRRRIVTWLRNGVTKIGVHGIKGIGKTAVMKNIHNQLLGCYEHVYFITVPEDQNEYNLQAAIAKDLGIDLKEEDLPKRAAFLHRALRQRNFVLILDGLKKYLSEDKVGIPLGAGTGKMIITSRSPDVCRKIGCQNNIITIDPLPYDEALDLFNQVQQAFELKPPIEKVAQKIVEQCRGVPLKIVEQATNLRGEDDIDAWENCLNEMLKAYE
ncbi:putative disease resistance protein At3g15700 [Chenopodium quinoa]|uniref:putative disease resistance protein At3g15700 n=1 Tax=Chenopodium quinoa TaxID=63459 RepID=UPI000B77022A|nr:putative disease resistance protein At3g15700 [Chenopodium quinoa]XP_021726067.1 putative disease resistance protein At3g15700 [Chenopodium quinoa]